MKGYKPLIDYAKRMSNFSRDNSYIINFCGGYQVVGSWFFNIEENANRAIRHTVVYNSNADIFREVQYGRKRKRDEVVKSSPVCDKSIISELGIDNYCRWLSEVGGHYTRE